MSVIAVQSSKFCYAQTYVKQIMSYQYTFRLLMKKKIMEEKRLMTISCVSIFQELLKALIGFIDVAGLYFALTQLTHRNISQNHKFQAVGLGKVYLPIYQIYIVPLVP